MAWNYFVLISLMMLNFTTACVFDEVKTESLESRNIKKKSLIMKMTKSGAWDSDIWNKITEIAGPFNISDFSDENRLNAGSTWDHKDQDNWYKTYPQCGGSNQSPVNIPRLLSVNSAISPIQFFNYGNNHPFMNIVNNGHSVEVFGPWGGLLAAQPYMMGGPLNGTYKLAGIHFHWGDKLRPGSEHTISLNRYSFEMHFVHYKNTYQNTGEALASGDPEGLSVIGVLFENSLKKASDSVNGMMNTLVKAQKGELINPPFFPLDLAASSPTYYTYLGSLTTPTCNEAVRWIVLDKVLPLTKNHVDIFRTFTHNGEPIVNNFRDTQSLNKRKVKDSKQSKF